MVTAEYFDGVLHHAFAFHCVCSYARGHPSKTKTTPIPDIRLVRDEDGSVGSQSGTRRITDKITDVTLEDLGF